MFIVWMIYEQFVNIQTIYLVNKKADWEYQLYKKMDVLSNITKVTNMK